MSTVRKLLRLPMDTATEHFDNNGPAGAVWALVGTSELTVSGACRDAENSKQARRPGERGGWAGGGWWAVVWMGRVYGPGVQGMAHRRRRGGGWLVTRGRPGGMPRTVMGGRTTVGSGADFVTVLLAVKRTL